MGFFSDLVCCLCCFRGQADVLVITDVTDDDHTVVVEEEVVKNNIQSLNIDALRTQRRALLNCDFYEQLSAKTFIQARIDELIDETGNQLSRQVKDALKVYYRAQTRHAQYECYLVVDRLLSVDRVNKEDNVFLFEAFEPINHTGHSTIDLSQSTDGTSGSSGDSYSFPEDPFFY